MAKTDSYGNPVSTSSDAAIDHYDRGMHLFLGGEFGGLKSFEAAIEADPGFAVAHAGLARALVLESRMPDAKASIAAAEALAPSCNDRERAHIAAMSLVFSGDAKGARAAAAAHLRDHPRDAMVAQLCTSILGLIALSGEVGREAELLAFTGALLPQYGEDWWMMSMHAISLCETGRIDASRQLMENALALNPSNANASHFKAHAMYEAGETTAGRTYLGDWMQGYDRRAVLHGHLSWHLALWALDDGDEAELWRLVDGGVGPGASSGVPVNIATDTAAILYRAELAGIDVDPERWAALSDYTARFFPDPGMSFVDYHASLSHAMAGRGDRLAVLAENAKGFAGDLVQPLAGAWGAIAREDWATALDLLVPVLAESERIGGSRAQRDLIELAHVNVLLKLGRRDEAHRTLAMRRRVLAASPPVVGWA